MSVLRRLSAEAIGSLLLAATVVGSGVMAERLAGGNAAVALLANTGATVAVLATLIGAAYWFTASTSFANPAITIARSLSDTFAGIRPVDVPGFILAQFVGALLALLVARSLFSGVGVKVVGLAAEGSSTDSATRRDPLTRQRPGSQADALGSRRAPRNTP